MNYHRPNTIFGGYMTNNLAKKLTNLRTEIRTSKCAVCNAVKTMDSETTAAFLDVMDSTVTIQAITSALNSEGFKVSRYQLGEVRRNCVKGERDCKIFKGIKK